MAFRELINHINELGIPVKIPHYSIDNVTPWSGDMTRIIAAQNVPKASLHNFKFTDVSVQAHNAWSDANYRQTSTAQNELTIALLGDSYAINLRTLIGGTFAQSYFERRPESGGKIIESVDNILLVYKPNIIVFESVERSITNWERLVLPENLVRR